MSETAVLKLTATFTPEEGGFVVRCPELDVTTEGDTFEEAIEYLYDAITAYIDIIGLDQILQDNPQLLSSEEIFVEQVDVKHKIAFSDFTLSLSAVVPAA